MANEIKKYASLENLQTFKENADELYATQTSVDNLSASVDTKLAGKANSSHTHDDRYYTESEIDTKLANKSDSSHKHDDLYDAKGAADKVQSNLEDMGDTFDSVIMGIYGEDILFDSETETITTIRDIANDEATIALDTAKSYTDTVASGKANTSHTHDDRYYTETEIDTKLSGKSDTSHNHDSKYDAKGSASAVQSNLNTVSDTLDAHTGNADIHFTSAERTKLSGIAAGAQKNTITGVKGSAESSYRTGNVNITAANIGLGNVNNTSDANKPVSTAQQTAIDTALASAKSYTDTKTSGLASTSSVATQIDTHNTSTSAHDDIRALISDLSTAVNKFLDVDDTTTDQLSEVLTLIENNKGTLDSLTTSKINVSDIVNNLTTNSTSKVLSAAQGVTIKGLIDALQTELDSHTHAISDVVGLQSALDGKAASSHGTHVSYSTTAPVMDGTASVGSAGTVARSDHRHPTDTSRAAQTDLDALAEVVAGKANSSHTHTKSQITNFPTSMKNPNALTINDVSYDGSSAVTVDTAKAFYITITANGSGGYQANKTPEEIIRAYQNGDTLLAIAPIIMNGMEVDTQVYNVYKVSDYYDNFNAFDLYFSTLYKYPADILLHLAHYKYTSGNVSISIEINSVIPDSVITENELYSELAAFETRTDAAAKLTESKSYTDTKVDELSADVIHIDVTDNEDITDTEVDPSSISIDTYLSTTSTNPVQNKVVTAELNSLSSQITPITYGTDDLTAGTSSLETGKLYFVYE